MILPLLLKFNIVKPKLPSPPLAEVYQVSSKCMRNFVIFRNPRVQFSSRILRHLDKATDGNFTSKVRLAI